MALDDMPGFADAVARASAAFGLADDYRASVRPLFRMPKSQWPTCCGASCEPCAQTLIAVAERVCELLAIDPESLPL